MKRRYRFNKCIDINRIIILIDSAISILLFTYPSLDIPALIILFLFFRNLKEKLRCDSGMIVVGRTDDLSSVCYENCYSLKEGVGQSFMKIEGLGLPMLLITYLLLWLIPL